MALRTVGVKLVADVSTYVRNMGSAARSTSEVTDEIDDVSTASDRAVPSVEKLGKSTSESGREASQAGRKFQEMKRDLESLDRQILETEVSLTALAHAFAKTGDTENLDKLKKQQGTLRDLFNVRKLLPDPDPAATNNFGKTLFKGIQTGIQSAVSSSPGAAAAGIIGAAMAPSIAAGLAGALTGGVALAAITGGLVLAAKDPLIGNLGKQLGGNLMDGLTAEAKVFKQPMIQAMTDVQNAAKDAMPKIGEIFKNTAPQVDGLTKSLTKAGSALLDSFVSASANSGPAMAGIDHLIETVGHSVGGMITTLSKDSEAGKSAIDDLADSLDNFIHTTTTVLDGLAKFKSGLDAMDKGIDSVRYKLEDHSRFVDLTADGYKKGSEAAELYRKGLIGVAGSANDYKQYLADANKEQEHQTALMTGAISVQSIYNDALARGVVTADDVKDANDIMKASQQDLTHTLDAMGGKMSYASQMANALRTAMDNLYGASMRQVDANEAYEAGMDGLASSVSGHTHQVEFNVSSLKRQVKASQTSKQATDDSTTSTRKHTGATTTSTTTIDGHTTSTSKNTKSVDGRSTTVTESTKTTKKHKTVLDADAASLDIHTKTGRENRDVLEGLITSTNDLYVADIAAGDSIEVATGKHKKRIAAVKTEAEKVGFNTKATQDLIDTYGNIPGKKETDLVVQGVQNVVDQLAKIYVLQLAESKGIPLESAEALVRNSKPAKNIGFHGLATGGRYEGLLPGAPSSVDNLVGMGPRGDVFGLAGGEYIINAEQTRKHLPLIKAINSGDEGFAAGGGYGVVDASSSYNSLVNAAKAKIMSKEEALSKVSPPDSFSGSTGDMGAGGAGWKWMVAAAHKAFPGLGVYSTFRKNSTTLSGNKSYHSVGRAVDFAPSKPFAEWVNANYFGRTRELITPWNSLNIHNGKRHTYTGAIFRQHNFAGGNAHDHWAMAHGGVIPEPVFGVGRSGRTYSFGEKGPERVIPNGGYAAGGLYKGLASGGLVNFASSTGGTSTTGGSKLETASAMLSAKAAVDALTASLKENGRTWSTATAKGRENRTTLISGIRAAQDAAKAKYEETGSVKAANKVYDDYVHQLTVSMTKMKVNYATRKALLKAYSERPKYDLPAAAAPTNSASVIRATSDHIAIEDALVTAKQGFAWTKPTFNVKTETGRAELTQLFGFLSTAASGAQSMYDYMGNKSQAMSYYNGYIAQLKGVLVKSGMSSKAVDDLIKRYGRITLEPKANRWGGLYEHAAAGSLRDATIASGGPTRYAWAEASTGGELFAPKNGNLAKTRAEVGWAVGNWWGGQVNWGNSSSSTSGPRSIVIDATIPITLGAETITRQVRIEVDTAVGQIANAAVYQTA